MKPTHLLLSLLLIISSFQLQAQGVKISGEIRNVTTGHLTDAVVNFKGDLNSSVLSNKGIYEIKTIGLGSNEVLSINSDPESPSHGVNTLDLVYIQLHILGKKLLDSPFKRIAADVNKTNTITVGDIVELRKLILHIIDKFTVADSWEFYAVDDFKNPVNLSRIKKLNNIQQNELVNFAKIKIGDVYYFIDPPPLKNNKELRNNNPYSININDNYFRKGEFVEMSIEGNDLNNLQALQFTLQYDKDKLEYVGISSERDDINEDNFGLTYLEKGLITGSILLNVEQTYNTLFKIKFKALASGKLSDALNINSSITPAEAYDKNDETLDLKLLFNENSSTTSTLSSALSQNEPNPFNNSSTINFSLSENQMANLSIYNMDGKLIKELKSLYSKGANQVIISKDDLPASGIYYYQLKTNDFSDTKKMILIK